MAKSAAQRLFVVYSRLDREWVHGFLLPALGLPEKGVLTPEKFRPGAAVTAEFGAAVQNSPYTLLVLTPAFLLDEWAQFGEQLAAYASVIEKRARLIPLLLKAAKLPLEVEFRVRLDFTDKEQWEPEAARLRRLLEQPEPAAEEIPCPYPGLKPYTKEDAGRFFGRENDILGMLKRLRLSPFLAVVGPSGSGKSSVVQAGLMPRLPKSGYFTPQAWQALAVRPAGSPFEALAQALCRHSAQSKESLLTALEQEPGSLGRILAETARHPPAPSNILLFLDQFEEVFAQCKDLQLRGRFFDQLCALAASPPEHVYLILALRADFFGDLQDSALWKFAQANLYPLPSLSADELRQAIRLPASQAGVLLEPALVERLLADAGETEKGVLPLLQEALQTLWEQHRQRRLLDLAGYLSMGREGKSGLQVAISEHADAVIGKLTDVQKREAARRILVRLVEYGGHVRTRRQLPPEQLRAASDGDKTFNDVLDYLADERLLTVDRDEKKKIVTVDLIHEMLIESWETLAAWVESYQAEEEERRSVWLAATAWLENRREPSYLLRGARLRKVESWAREWSHELGGRELEFLKACRRRRGLQYGLAAGAALIVLGGLAAWFGGREYARLTTSSLLVEVRGGPATIGSEVTFEGSLEQPLRTVELETFQIEKFEVTNRQYQACMSAGHCDPPLEPIDASQPDHAVVWVSFAQAQDYCRWIGRRLPTAVEWERAARGPEGRLWPWGDDPWPAAGYEFPDGPIPVDQDEETATPGPERIFHLADNVKEWVVRVGQDCRGQDCQQAWDGTTESGASMGGAYDAYIERISEIQPAGLYAPDPSTGFRCAVGGADSP